MAKAKVYQYRIQYVDDTYQIVDWTKGDFTKVADALMEGKTAALVSDCVFRVSDIRAIVLLPEIKEEKPKDEKEKEPELSEYGHYDFETIQWLRDNGIDIGGAN